jgi:hypothetical protein
VAAQGTGLLIAALRRQLAQATAVLHIEKKRAGDVQREAAFAKKSAEDAWRFRNN